MSELIKPVVVGFQALLAGMTMPDGLAPFSSTDKAFTGVLPNPPMAFVMPGRTQFPNQGEGTARSQVHQITIRMGITGSDPDELTARVMAYVKAVDAAIEARLDTALPAYVKYVYVAEHDYGPMYRNGGAAAFWPDLHIQVEVEEF